MVGGHIFYPAHKISSFLGRNVDFLEDGNKSNYSSIKTIHFFPLIFFFFLLFVSLRQHVLYKWQPFRGFYRDIHKFHFLVPMTALWVIFWQKSLVWSTLMSQSRKISFLPFTNDNTNLQKDNFTSHKTFKWRRHN